MPLPKFVLNDERVKNSHGFYLLNAGGRFDRFAQNPVMLDNHDLDRLIGRWDDLTVEGSLLTAVPVFDEGTELGRERMGQVERGFLRGASIGLYIYAAEYRKNPTSGEDELFVTDWEMIESSTTSIPSNAGALSLKIYDAARRPVAEEQLAAYLDHVVQLTLNKQDMTPNNTTGGGSPAPAAVTLTAAAQVALGIPENATAEAVSAAIVALAAKCSDAEQRVATLEAAATAAHQKAVQDMISLAIKEGRITADQRNTYEKLAAADYEATKAALEALPGKASLAAQVTRVAGGSSIPAERSGWTLLRWMKEDMAGLNRIKAEDPQAYEAIVKRS